MNCILIFDQFNDILYTKCNKKFSKHVKKLGKLQGLISDQKDEDELSPNVLIQLFSPIVTSQRVMNCQFGNSYSSVQSLDGTNMIFDEYMGYLFVHIGMRDVNWLKRMLGLCISIVKHLCGPDVSMLKSDKSLSSLLSRLLDTWVLLQDSDQAVLVEAVEQLMVNTDLSLTTLRTLQDATEKLKAGTDCAKIHAMVLVDNKFLSLYSSRSAQDLTASDTMFLSLLSESFHLVPPESSNMHDNATESEDSDEYYSPENTPQDSPTMLRKTEPAQEEYNSPVAVSNLESLLSVEKINSRATSPNPKSLLIENKLSFVNNEVIGGIRSYLVMLMGSGAAYNPHAVHIATLEEGVNLILMFEVHVSDGAWHTVVAHRRKRHGYLQVDGETPSRSLAEPGATLLNTNGRLWIGGAPTLPSGLPASYYLGFKGCVEKIKVSRKTLDMFNRLGNDKSIIHFCHDNDV